MKQEGRDKRERKGEEKEERYKGEMKQAWRIMEKKMNAERRENESQREWERDEARRKG